jgi:UrcA family protein
MNNTAIKRTLSIAAICLTAGFGMNASAGTVDETLVQGEAVQSKSVTFARAELRSEEGLATVERRVRQAAKAVCGPIGYKQAGGLSRAAKNRACFDEAVDSAMSQIGADQLASID